MVSKQEMVRIEPNLYEIPKSFRDDMRVPARIYADERMLDVIFGDRSIEQLINTATLPGVVGYALAMPDAHQGYGFPIGGVAATALPKGAISPGGVGYDINCGVRLLASNLEAEALQPHMDKLMSTLFGNVSVGVGSDGAIGLSEKELTRLLHEGSRWIVQRGHGTQEDLAHTEDGGCMASADAATLSARALERGRSQIGSLGSGNHFLEVDEITEIYDSEAAEVFGLVQGRACVWIHCGSRGLGHQVCSDAVRAMQSAVKKYGYQLPDRELVCAPFDSPEGQRYFGAMSCAANYAWANRQMITHLVRNSFEQALSRELGDTRLRVVYDVCHNIAKVEEHEVDGRKRKLCVHRKGATRAFGPGRPEVPGDYRGIGQPVLIPGDMQSGSYVLVGTEAAMQATFGSTAHGAGRLMSRTQARKSVRGEKLRAELESQQIVVRAGSLRGLAEEAPLAYKDLDHVVQIVHASGIAHRVARTRPLGVIKG
ncbi:MAG: RtcB family protein [Anaerolineae bacterium]|nr:RtcB family protein [Anaerolineae bacterium]